MSGPFSGLINKTSCHKQEIIHSPKLGERGITLLHTSETAILIKEPYYIYLNSLLMSRAKPIQNSSKQLGPYLAG